MKKGLEKFISILLTVLGGILIIFLSLAVFGQLDEATMANEVVRTMILGLALVFLVAAVVMIVLSFKDSDVLKAVVLSSERASTTRVSLSVIRRIVAKNAKYISGLKVTGVTLSLDENNAIRMKLTVKISENDVDFVVDRFRCLLYDAFYAVLGVEFASIDFQVKALSPKYAPDMNKVDRAAAEIKEKREKLMLQKLKMEEEEARFEEERKREAEKRRKEEARLRREREEQRRREREAREQERLGDLADAEEVPVYVIEDDFEMPEELAEEPRGGERPAAGTETRASDAGEQEPSEAAKDGGEVSDRDRVLKGAELPESASEPTEDPKGGAPDDASGSESVGAERAEAYEAFRPDGAEINSAVDAAAGIETESATDRAEEAKDGGAQEIAEFKGGRGAETLDGADAPAEAAVKMVERDAGTEAGAAGQEEAPRQDRVEPVENSADGSETLDGADASEYSNSVGSEASRGDAAVAADEEATQGTETRPSDAEESEPSEAAADGADESGNERTETDRVR